MFFVQNYKEFFDFLLKTSNKYDFSLKTLNK